MLDNNNQPHDYYFRSMMANINNAKGLLSRRLPEHIKQIVNLNSLKACKETYIDEDMKKYQLDTLYQADFGDRAGYIYLLLEHQSSIDKHMPFRMLKS